MMTLGQRGEALIKSFEKLVLVAYRKFAGEPWTCGWGNTCPDVGPNTTCTPEKADLWFQLDTESAVRAVNHTVTVPLSQNQFDALVCFTYNVGTGAEAHSTLVAKVNAGDFGGAAEEFLKWDHVNGVEVDGLKRRRTAERDLFQGEPV